MEVSLQTLLTAEDGILRLGGSRMALMDIEAGFWGLRRQMEALVGRQLTDNAMQQAGANAGAAFARSYAPQVSAATAESQFRACIAAYQAGGFGKFSIEILQWPLGRAAVTGRETFEAWMTQRQSRQSVQPVCFYTAGVLAGFINALTGRKDIVCIEHTCQAQGDQDCRFELLLASEAESIEVVADDRDPSVVQPMVPPTRPQELLSESDELSTLLEISQNVASTLELEPLLGLILDRFQGLVAYDGAAVLTVEEESLRVLAYRGPIPQKKALALRFPLDQAGANQLVIRERRPVIIPDIRGDAPLAHAFQAMAGDQLRGTFGYIRSWMGVPLISRGKVIGMLSLDHGQPNAYTRRHSLLARTFADQVAVAIENARLYQEEQDRRRELQTLLDVASAAGSSLDLEEMLATTLDRLVDLVGASRAGVLLADARGEKLEPLMIRPQRHIPPAELAELTRASEAILAGGEPLYIEVDAALGYLEPGAFMPLRARGTVIGLIAIIGETGGRFSAGQLTLFNSIADQVAVAVENAHLYEQAEQAAAAAERNRLARDLHDAVSQTLFSASLIAEVLPRLWEKKPEEGRRRLEELRELTRGALAEMRALLMELRPSTLADFTLADLLRQLAEAAIGRSRLAVDLSVEGDCPLPPEVKIAFYRIAQEALHNIGKHAGADAVQMRLQMMPTFVQLVVHDNGRGFDVTDVAPGSLGLGIMRERAAAIGALLSIESEIGAGTTINVHLDRRDDETALTIDNAD